MIPWAQLVSLLLVAALAVSDETFKITWYHNRTEELTFPTSKFGSCLYDRDQDVTKCMYVRPFKEIKDAWRYDPESFKYLSVRCQAQENYSNHRHVCICKNAADAANPGQSQQHDRHYYCQITKLTNKMFSTLSNMEVLDLSDNNILLIEGDALESVHELKYLDLSRNPLRELSGGFLCDAKKLRILIMENTRFLHFPVHIFDCGVPMDMLEYVDLSDNIMSSIGDMPFRHIPNVLSLDISSNNFSHFQINSFMGANKLVSLDMSENDISSFPEGMCQSLPKLEYLFMAENLFKEFNMTVLSECANLKYLNVSVNGIGVLNGQTAGPSKIESLILSRNSIKSVSRAFLKDALSLSRLDLSMNLISSLSEDSFLGLSNLERLDLSDNLLNESINLEHVLKPLKALSSLDLSVNQFITIRSGSFIVLSQLEILNISRNRISILEDKAFYGLSQLKILDLRINQIKTIESNIFSKLQSLMSIDLSYNEILSLDDLDIPKGLVKIDVTNNKLEHFPNCFENTSIQNIILKRNEIQYLRSSASQNISTLRFLDLSRNTLRNIEVGYFEHMTNLKSLNLSRNDLILNLTKDIFQGLNSLINLDLSFNQLQRVEVITSFSSLSDLQHLNLSNNPISSIYDLLPNDMPTNNTKLQHVDFNTCNIEYVGQESFDGFSGLARINLSKNSMRSFQPFQTQSHVRFNLKENPLICECNMKWLLNNPESRRSYMLPRCVVYPMNMTISMQSVKEENFLCGQTDNCPSPCRCYSKEPIGNIVTTECASQLQAIPSSIPTSTISLHLMNNNLTTLRFDSKDVQNFLTEDLYLNNSQIQEVESNFFTHFTKLKRLYFDNNNLLDIKRNTFSSLIALEELYLRNNKLTNFRADIIQNMDNLKILDLRFNNIWHIPTPVLTEFSSMRSLRQLYMGHNSYRCDCKNLDFHEWINNNKYLLYDRRDIQCRGKELGQVDKEHFVCATDASDFSNLNKKNVIITAVVLLAVLAILLTAFIYYRRDIVAALYTRFKWDCFRHKYPDKVYDVFLVYDTNDGKSSEWVESSLLPRLTRNESYRVVIPDKSRIIECGSDTEIAKMFDCKCCVFILSKFVTSNQYCTDCFTKAYTLSKSNKEFNLIMLIHGDIDISILEPGMRKLLSAGNYITIRSRSVWDRLFHELPNPRRVTEPFREEDDLSETDVIIYKAPSTKSVTEDYGTVMIN